MTQWIEVKAIIPEDAYEIIELARACVFEIKSCHPVESIAWGIVLELLAAEYLAGDRSPLVSYLLSDCIQATDSDILKSTQLYEIMTASRRLNNSDLEPDKIERVFTRLDTIVEQLKINPLDFISLVAEPYLERSRAKDPNAVRVRELEERIRQLEALLTEREST
jgi:hypothetical protein